MVSLWVKLWLPTVCGACLIRLGPILFCQAGAHVFGVRLLLLQLQAFNYIALYCGSPCLYNSLFLRPVLFNQYLRSTGHFIQTFPLAVLTKMITTYTKSACGGRYFPFCPSSPFQELAGMLPSCLRSRSWLFNGVISPSLQR